MGKEVTFEIPPRMTPEEAAQTFTAFLLGRNSFRNGDGNDGPFKEMTSCQAWQLDGSNDFWLHDLGGGRMNLRCRYDREIPVIEAAVALFKARFCR